MENVKEKKTLPFRTILFWYWRVVRKYRWWFYASFLIYGAGILFADVFTVVAYKHIIDILAGSGIEGRPDIWKWFLILAGFHLAHFVLFRVGDIFFALSQSRSVSDLSQAVFSEMHRHSYGFFSDRFSGSLTSQARRFIDAFITLHDALVFTLWLSGVQLLGMFVVIALFSPALALFFLVAVIAIILIVVPLLKKRRTVDEEEAEVNSRLAGRFSDAVANILTIKVFSNEGMEKTAFGKLAAEEERARMKSWKIFILLSSVQNGLITLLQISIFFFAIFLWTQGKVTVGTVVLVQTYLLSIFGIVWSLTHTATRFLKAMANASEMIEIFELPSDVGDPEHPATMVAPEGRIEFAKVSFRYADGKDVFRDLSFCVQPTEKVGLVGPSGGGKTTVTKLLLRFADPQEGAVLIDGQDIRTLRQDDLRSKIAYVAQDSLLFHRSLRENISYGHENASHEQIREAARKAHAHRFIEKLAKGYETLVGERGVKLSGGERQRVAIARAILKDAPILVLDEATSALDSESEHAIQLALDELMKGRTAIVIAHRLSTIRKMDRIIVLGDTGEIVEEGNHKELLAKGGLYSKLWSHQTGGFIDE